MKLPADFTFVLTLGVKRDQNWRQMADGHTAYAEDRQRCNSCATSRRHVNRGVHFPVF